MIKGHLREIAGAVAALILIPLAMLYIPPVAQSAPVKPAAAPKQETRKEPAPAAKESSEGVDGSSSAPAYLAERNIFAENGTYIVPKNVKAGASAPAPQDVRVLGIVNPGVRRAFIVDPYGRILDLKAGDNVDGLQIRKITDTAVFLRMGNKDMELKLFAIGPVKKPGADVPAFVPGAAPPPPPQVGQPQQPWTPPTGPIQQQYRWAPQPVPRGGSGPRGGGG